MRDFTDSTGRTWTLALTLAAMKRVRDLAGIDIPNGLSGTLIERIAINPIVCGEIAAAALRPTLSDKKVSEDEFLAALDGKTWTPLRDAILTEICDFFPELGSAIMNRALDAERLRREVPRQLAEMMAATTAAAMVATVGGPPTSSPASAE